MVSALFLCIQAGQGLGDNAASALFFLRFGVDFLPYMYIMLGVLTFITTLSYSAGLGRIQKSRFFTGLLAGFAVLLVLERGTVMLDFPSLYPILWLTINGIGMILGTLIWNVATDVFDTRQAKRLFPIFTSAGILGSVLGNSITGLVANELGTENLLIIYAGLMVLTLVVVRAITPLSASFTSRPTSSNSVLADFRTGYDVVRGSRLLRLAAYASVLFSVLFFSIAFPFSKVATASFPDEAGVAGFLGLFSSITTTVTFFVSLLLANRIYTRLGIVNTILLLPITYIAGFGIFGLFYTLPGAVFARFAQLVLLSGICSAAWSTLFNVVPLQQRGQVVAFDNGVPSQIGVVLSGLLLIMGEKVLTIHQIFLMGTAVAFVCAFLVWRMRGAYGEALIAALRAGRVEVFIPNAGIFQRLIRDSAAVNTASKALNDSDPNIRRLGAEMLAQIGAPNSGPVLAERLSDPDPSVRAAIVRGLGELGSNSAAAAVIASLDDIDSDVCVEAVRALPKLMTSPPPPVLDRLQKIVESARAEEACQATVTLAEFGHEEIALDRMQSWLLDKDTSRRSAALSGLREIAMLSPETRLTPRLKALLRESLQDPVPQIRRCACECLSQSPDPSDLALLIQKLYDRDDTVRQAAAASLQKHRAKIRPQLAEVLNSQDMAAESAALDVFSFLDMESRTSWEEAIQNYINRKIGTIRQLRSLANQLPEHGQMTELLRTVLAKRATACEDLIIKGIGVLSDAGTLETIRRGVRSSNPGAHSAALEALEAVSTRSLTQKIVPLFEEAEDAGGADTSAALPDQFSWLLSMRDPWLLALGALAAAELKLRSLIEQIRDLQANPNDLVRQAANHALKQLVGQKETNLETLKTIPTLERILLLQKVPMFTDLTPEDLQQISELSTEQLVPDRTMICREGDTGSAMYIIVSGNVEVVKQSNGTEKILAVRRDGDFVGEMAIIESSPRSTALRAQGEVRLLVIEGQAFKTILHDRPQVSLSVLQSMSRRLREISV